ncbi:MAG: hypothetical protein ACRDTA_12300 [Pseudonocardiaceae bacterium]
MSAPELTRPLTARIFLLGESQGEDTPERVARSLNERGITGSAVEGVRRLSASARKAVEDEIATVAEGLLDFDLGSVLVSGWRKYTELTCAAERTLAVPGSEEVVILAAHKVSSTHHPSIELLVDGVKVENFVFDLTVEFDLTGVVAVVQRGELVALRGGECTITVTLTFEKIPLVPPQKRKIDLAIVVPLHPPISLVREVEALR